jgi:2-amino-4-hydroxy-6-hydroxymethyldihydropteridine diphosphokinase
MGPLAEIAPGWAHPILGRTAEALSREAAVGADATPTESHSRERQAGPDC